MKTNWQEIKESVELKVGEEIETKRFRALANETTSELNEIAYIEADPVYYENDEIIDKDITHDLTLNDIFTYGKKKTERAYSITLPFEYTYGHHDLKLEVTEKPDDTSTFHFEEIESYNGKNDEVIVHIGSTVDHSKSIEYKLLFTLKVLRSVKQKNNFYNNIETVIKLPENLSSITKIEVIDNMDNNDVAIETSINSMEQDNMDTNIKSYRNLYYVMNGVVHMYSQVKPVRIILYYIRRMNKVIDMTLSLQKIEMELNYQNLLILGIATKWWENFVGMKDSETKAMYQRYQILKQEYEQKNMPRKIKKRQRYIRVL